MVYCKICERQLGQIPTPNIKLHLNNDKTCVKMKQLLDSVEAFQRRANYDDSENCSYIMDKLIAMLNKPDVKPNLQSANILLASLRTLLKNASSESKEAVKDTLEVPEVTKEAVKDTSEVPEKVPEVTKEKKKKKSKET